MLLTTCKYFDSGRKHYDCQIYFYFHLNGRNLKTVFEQPTCQSIGLNCQDTFY